MNIIMPKDTQSSITEALFGNAPQQQLSLKSSLDFTPVQKAKPDIFAAKAAPLRPQKLSRRQAEAAAIAAAVEAAPTPARKKRRLEQPTAPPPIEAAVAEKHPKRHKSHKLDDHEAEDERTVFVGNLPNNVAKKDVEKIFKDCGRIEAVRIRSQVLAKVAEGEKKRGRAVRVLRGEIDKSGNHSSHAYVLFTERSPQVAKALQLNGLVFQGRHIVVTKEDAASRAFPPQTSVFIGNVPFPTSDEAVYSFFDDRGLPVKRVRIVRDPETGLGKGFGYVEFSTPSSVKKAIAVRGEPLNGREIRICHVQKSTDPRIGQMQRRTKRKLEARAAVTSGPAAAGEKQQKQRQVMEDEMPPWMGTVTNPRKKLARDLRPLAEPNKPKERPRSGAPSAAKKSATSQAKKTSS